VAKTKIPLERACIPWNERNDNGNDTAAMLANLLLPLSVSATVVVVATVGFLLGLLVCRSETSC